ncbi:hypothetical protein EV652_10445 [Kribbella steppae]|uniref:Serine/threonine protein kinase n=1 Tax=Kribbella steppae TaxID=2512223 RepID=A0A4R2HNA8_9ACTN|nr:hypothetical protein [Kribbella steppae]TCO32439.1 hypothetical protein EV652_10445 [Kribbella steppae]
MGQRSPLVTLAATAVGLVALLVVNSTQTGTSSPGAAAPSVPATTSPPPSPDPTPTATPPAASKTTPAQQIVAVYTGRTTGREATLAIAVKGGRAAAYVCDGRSVEAWLTGTHTAGRLALRSKAGDQLVGTVAAEAVTGTVTVRGRQWSFTIDKADPPAGLYRAKTSSNTIGWIILPDGSQVGIDNDGTPAPAPPLDPASGAATVGGAEVTAASITGDETF